MSVRSRRLGAAGVVLAFLALSIAGVAPPTGAATSRVEAESLPAPTSCWTVLSWSALSGGQARACAGPGASQRWTVAVPAGSEGIVRLFGYRDEVPRGYRVSIDGGEWNLGTLTGAFAPSTLFYTSPALGAGTHTIDLEMVATGGAFTFDYYELETRASSSSSTSVASTSAPTAGPVTTSPSTSGPGGEVCKIRPRDGEQAIEAAIQACPDGSTVVFPAGAVYHQSNRILVKHRRDLVIDGNGSTFISSAPNDSSATIYEARPNWELVEGTNVTLKNLTVRGNLPPGPRGIIPGNQYNAGIIIYGGDGVFITDVSVYSVFGEFVVANPSGFHHGAGALEGQVPRNVRVTRLHGEHAARQCVAATAARGFWLEDSTLHDCYQNGVDIEPDVAGEPIRDVHILRNTISGFYFSALTIPTAYGPGDIDGVEMRGNTTTTPSDSCYPAVLLGGVQGNDVALHNVVVADNTLKTLYEGVKAVHVASGSVTGNSITIGVSPNYCGPPAGVPVRLVHSPNVVVASNTAYGY